MDWQLQLITVYVSVCSAWQRGIGTTVQRFSNHNRFLLSDEEVATLYLFGVMNGLTTIRQIYSYADRHLREWFPALGEYKALSHRLNRISASFARLCEILVRAEENTRTSTRDWVVDSLPIIMAGPKRSGRAMVAKEVADKGFCAAKDLFFYGVKLHCIGRLVPGTLPFPSFVGLAPASVNDHTVFLQVSHALFDGQVFADKAYGDKDHKKRLSKCQNVALHTPIKKTKGLFSLPGPETFSTWVSKIRQPIESFFSWLIARTGIQTASKVRSTSGLLVHVFGKLAAAIMSMIGI